MRRYRPVLVLAILLLAAGSYGCQSATPKPADTGVTDEEYAIYSVLIDNAKSIFTTHSLRPDYTVVVIEDITNGDAVLFRDERQRLSKGMPGLSRHTLDGFVARNKHGHQLMNRFKTKTKCVLISDKEVHAIFDKGDKGGWWPEFYRRYPKSQGILTLSRVGFSSRKDEALVVADNSRAALGGVERAVLLVKKNGAWSVQANVVLVMS